MIRSLLVILALGAGCVSAAADDFPVPTDEAQPQSMQFEWRTEGPAEQCGKGCRTWISAIGAISAHTASDFETFASHNNVQGATLVLDSEGGSVLAALELGSLIRRFDMTTTVGKTIALPPDDGKARAKLSPDASCESMCAFLLLGGARRHVPPEARVLVHQIWLGDRRERALEASYTAEDLELVQRDIGSIARYTVEMGGGIELLETALRVPPWNPMHALTAEEIRRVKLTTVDCPFAQDISPVASLSRLQAKPADASSNSLAIAVHMRTADRD